MGIFANAPKPTPVVKALTKASDPFNNAAIAEQTRKKKALTSLLGETDTNLGSQPSLLGG